ncbi:LuxR family transcriptional regulator [Streptomyces sp. CB01881]|uniref:helix-turn-helix transcriptional regulator n=1 Tax=Streptomyces sp. CB01881 TaxID=2078691 RepID=UPI000CDBBA03|nr:LuxR family transcriptional regulator [Streptomyces sp. CB01881]AUY47781.1 LuxR family transcriptional regulator [Streptomyces sp. CB01881]TYC76257.1 LuxR family transcriptional regulator [Streptomyces sp. CB01881]
MLTRSPALVGRKNEIALLERILRTLQDDSGHAVFVSGEAGIGKSRLAEECARQAADLGLPVLRGRGSPSGAGTPFRPLMEALGSGLRRTGPPQNPELVPYRPALARVVPEWRTADAPGRPDCVVELAEALLRLLAVLGREAGCVLVLEDLHDADSETLAVLEYLVDNVAGLPVLLLSTLRPEAGAAFDLLQAAERRRAASVFALGPLGEPDVRDLAAGCLGVPADGVPADVVDRLAEVGGGNPYLVEELLAEMAGNGSLRRDGAGWRVAGDLAATVPASVVRTYAGRAGRLDPPARELVVLAALLGPRFSAGTVQLITGHDDRRMFAGLRALVEAELVVPDRTVPDGYAFRHALIGEALLAGVPAVERAVVARRAAATLQQTPQPVPDPADDRCHLAARLLETAGDDGAAARLYAEAGRQALAGGTSGVAVRLLERGQRLAAPADRADITEALVNALAEAGRLDRALELLGALPTAGAAALDTDRRIALHTRLAWAALMGERSGEGAEQLAAAQALLGERGAPAHTAALAVVRGHLALLPGQEEHLADAEWGALTAAEYAQRAEQPVLACQAWQLLAMLARERGFDEADGYLARMLEVAEAHALPNWRFEALIRLGANSFMRNGDARTLEEALTAAQELGSITRAQRTEGLLAMYAVLTGDPERAREIIDRCLDVTARMRNLATHRYLLLTAATRAAHQGRRREMEATLQAFDQAGGGRSFLVPVMLGLCRAVCALLEEDRPLAEAELAAAADWERDHPNVFYLAGRYGLRPLLDVLAGRADRAGFAAVSAAPAAALAWNRQFLLAADAVLLGREGRADEAARAVTAMRAHEEVFPTGGRLALRLVAEAALEDGWGDPVAWLRAAEDYFHDLDVPAVAGACRSLLRRTGASVAQRRAGRDRIPAGLRAQGVTIREYEVFGQMAERVGNQEIARRLVISPRTVEKHLASLLRKTGLPDRAALHRLAAELGEA